MQVLGTARRRAGAASPGCGSGATGRSCAPSSPGDGGISRPAPLPATCLKFSRPTAIAFCHSSALMPSWLVSNLARRKVPPIARRAAGHWLGCGPCVYSRLRRRYRRRSVAVRQAPAMGSRRGASARDGRFPPAGPLPTTPCICLPALSFPPCWPPCWRWPGVRPHRFLRGRRAPRVVEPVATYSP